MRVLLITSLFQPEPCHLKGTEFVHALQRRGHEVHVLTGFPNYPSGRIYAGYRQRWTAREELDGVPITRVALYTSHDRSGLRRAASYASLGLSQALHCLGGAWRFDASLVALGPITLLWPAQVLRRLHGTRVVADVQDIWPESVADSGMLRSGAALRFLDWRCRRAYAAADRLLVLSHGYARALEARGVPADRIDVVHNWCEESAAWAVDARAPEGALDPAAFNVVYAGNLGRLQGLDTVLDAAARLAAAQPDVRFTLVGDGVEAERLRGRVAAERLATVRILGPLPAREAGAMLRQADALLVHVERNPLTRIGIPQKVQAYLAAGRPIVLAAEGDAAELVREAGGGLTCPPGDPAALAAAVARLARMGRAEREAMGRAGAAYYRHELRLERGVDRIERALQRATGAGPAPARLRAG